ncbi:MAG: hypothetical protein MJZ20_13600 [Bacteroidaceae bacterium]|nr:hypothetical protein [Bacteroidaceae bacterium]
MLNFSDQLAVLNLRERILKDEALRKRVLNLLGSQKGWQELANDLKCDIKIVRAISNLSIYSITNGKYEIAAERVALNQAAKEASLQRKTKRPAIIINGQSIPMAMTIVSKKPVTIITLKNNKVFQLNCCRRKHKEEVLFRHDYNAPIYLYGNIESFSCIDKKLTECYIVSCPQLQTMNLSQNKLKLVDIRGELPLLQILNLSQNTMEEELVKRIIEQLPILIPDSLFKPSLKLDAAQPSHIQWIVQQRGWQLE